MKRLSVKWRLTLFCTAIVTIIAGLVLLFVLLTTDRQFLSLSRSRLETAVREAFESVSYETDRLEIDSSLDLYEDGIMLVLYGPEGTLLLGSLPTGFPAQTPLSSDTFQTVGEASQWQVYDLYTIYPGQTGIWVRGIYPLDAGQSAVRGVTLISLIALPLLILIAGLGGYLITKRAMLPLQRMNTAVAGISGGQDLSRRLESTGGKDEIAALAANFNAMFDRLEASFEGERQFTSDVSHELRTPLAVILSQCEYALSKEDPAARQEALEAVLEQSRRMSAIINGLLEYARAMNKETALHPLELDMAALCRDVAEDLAPIALEKDIRIDCSLPEACPFTGDPTFLNRMLVNLTANAIEYGRPGGYVRIALINARQWLTLSVEDNGIGIPPEIQANIFQRLYRADKARRNTDGRHLGLGLSMVKWIAEAHGGSVRVESTPGQGSTFIVTLPNPPACAS